MPVLSPHRSTTTSSTSSLISSGGGGGSNYHRSTFSPSSSSTTSSSASSLTKTSKSFDHRSSSSSYFSSGSTRVSSYSSSERYLRNYRSGSVIPSLYNEREDSSRTGGSNSIYLMDSVAELRNKYSPSNYVPAHLRTRDPKIDENNGKEDSAEKNGRDILITRSKSINDIESTSNLYNKYNLKKVNDLKVTTAANKALASNFTNNINNKISEDTDEDDDNNNNRKKSVADLKKKFSASPAIVENNMKNMSKKQQQPTISKSTKKTKEDSNEKLTKNDIGNTNLTSSNNTSKLEVNSENDLVNHVDDDTQIENFDSEDLNKKRNELSSTTSPKLTTTNSRLSTPSPSNNSSSSTNSSTTSNNLSKRNQNKHQQQQLGLNGLKNIGNTCFMNSVIQCLSNTKQLLEYLLQDTYFNDINTTTSSMKGALMKSFAEVIKELWSDAAIDSQSSTSYSIDSRVVNTTNLKSQIQRFAPRFIGYAQQDAQEFLRYLLEGLHEDVNRVKQRPKLPILNDDDDGKIGDDEKASEMWQRYLKLDNSKIVDCFVGQLKSTLKCTYCGHCSVTFDPFWDLSLPIPTTSRSSGGYGSSVKLTQCLDGFTKEETLDGDEKPTCSKCKERRRCTKSFSIQKFPKILVIHLKRFSLAERFRGKLSVTVDFPLEGLDLSQYSSLNSSDSSMQQQNASKLLNCRYNLYAISNHSGTTYSGHYTAYCRHPYTRMWHEYNDSRVSSISSKSIVSGEAYVLFYEQDGQKSHL